MSKRALIFSILPFLLFVLALGGLFIRSAANAPVGVSRSLFFDNVTTSGKVLAVGPSTVGSGPATVTYCYDVPGYPRNGNAGSYTREQVTTPADMARFRVGMAVPVEYSRTIPGSSRMKGFGGGSVFFNEMVLGRQMLPFLLLCVFTLLLTFVKGMFRLKRAQAI